MAIFDSSQHAVAVILCLVEPLIAFRRVLCQKGQFNRNPSGQWNLGRGGVSDTLITSCDQQTDMAGLQEKLDELKQSLLEYDVALEVRLNEKMHDREVRLDNGWTIKVGRGLDFYQKPEGWYAVGSTDLSLRRCLETKVDVFRNSLSES
ncbi:MIT C-terminal domain-containing protein [Microvirga rosea]|uniref:MIT C-terminal domain-containing protein n=1 Tax=Microvirga rosea TaxID=2715425 RepID=UPI001D0A4708|nr:MIT C-terminal domain-containing protein [Microvirga rosea]MCB8823187.1 hypothetical protein [Microvirga rosea]